MLFKLTQEELERYQHMREELDTSEREALMQKLEHAQEGASGFSAELMQIRNVLYQLEDRIRRLDQILEHALVVNPDRPEDVLAFELNRIKYGAFDGEGAALQAGDSAITLQQRIAGPVRQVQLKVCRQNSRPAYVCLQTDLEKGRQDYYILAKPIWECADPAAIAAAHYASLAQAAASAYLPYLLIVYYLVQDAINLQDGIPNLDYYLDDELYRYLAECPAWRPLPDGQDDLETDSPGKKPVCRAQILLPEEGLQLAVEYSPAFGYEYQVLPAESAEDEEDYLEEHYHLREILDSAYLRYYLMLLGAIEDPAAPFIDL